MGKNRRDFGSDAPNAEATFYNTVFVDTSLDTHLVLTISSSDTVYDFKEKMLRQHSEIFPKINGVKIHSVQVKRLGHFYHLPDSMLVSSAFGGSKRAWFVFVEASCSGEHDKELVLCGATLEKDFRVSPLAACSGDDDCRNNNETTEFSRLDELPSMLKKRKIECIENVGLTMNKKNKVGNKIDPQVDATEKVQSDMETRKIVGELCDTLSSDTNLILASGAQKTSESETILEQTGEFEREEVYRDKSNSTTGEHMTELEKVPPSQEVEEDKLVTGLVSRKDKKQKKILSVSHEQLAISQPNAMLIGSVSPANLNTQAPEANKHEAHMELVPNDDPKLMLSKRCNPLDEVGADGTNNESVPSLNFSGTSSLTEVIGSVGTKKKKTKTKKKAPGSTEVGTKITDPLSSTVADLALKGLKNDKIVNDQIMLSLDESQKNDTSEKEMVPLCNHDPQVQPSESVKPSDQIEAQEMSEGGADETNSKSVPSLNFMGTSSPTEAVGSVGTKKKKTPGSAEVGTKIIAPLSATVADLALKDLKNDKIENDQTMLSLDKSQKNDTSEKEIVLLHDHDSHVQPSESVKPSDQIEAQEMSEGGADGTNNKSIPSQNFIGTSSPMEAVAPDRTKKKKTKTKKKAPDSTEVGTKITAPLSSTVADIILKDLKNDEIVNDQSTLSLDDGQKNDTSDKEIVLSHNHDSHVQPSENVKPSHPIEAQEMNEGEADGTNSKSVPSLNFMGISSPTEADAPDRTKKKKTKTRKRAPDSSEVGSKITAPLSSTVADLDLKNDEIVNDQSLLSLDESQKNDTSEKEIVLSHNLDSQVQPPESVKASDQFEAQEMNKGSIFSSNLSLPNEVVETGRSGTIKRKKLKAKKSAAKLQDKSDIDNPHETYLPAQGVALDVEMNDVTAERNKAISQIDNLKYNSELSSRYKSEGNKILDSAKETLNEKTSGFAEMSLDHGIEAGKSGRSHRKKRAKLHAAIDEDSSPMEHSNPVNASPAKHIKGDRGLSLKTEPEVTSSKASKTSDLGEVTVNCSEPGFTGQKLDNENGLEVVKSGGSQKKKRTKKHTNSVCDAAVKHFASEAQENQSTLCGTVEKEKTKKGARDSSISCATTGNESSGSKRLVSPFPDPDQTQETAINLHDNLRVAKNDENMDTSALQDQPIRLQANEVQQLLPGEADKEQVIGENIKKKVKKPKRNLKNVAETQSNSKIKRKNARVEDVAASGDKMGDWDPQCDSMDRSASAGTRTGNKSTLAEVQLGKHAGVGSKSSNPAEDLKGACSSEFPKNIEGRPETEMNTKNIAEISKAGDGVNFGQYFVSEQQQIEGSSANKVKEALHSTKAKRETKKPNFISDQAVKANQVRHNIDANQLEESSADAKGNKDLPLTSKEKSEAYGDVMKASKSHDVDEEKTSQKSKTVVGANGSGSSRNNHFVEEENNGNVTASSSSSSAKGSKRTFQDTTNKKQQSGFNKGGISAEKVLSKKDGDIVNSSQQKKSLLNAPGAIFSDDSSESSGNENHGNSDASTRRPSGHSSSSGFSDGESELSQDSRRTGLGNAKKEDGGRKSSLNSKHPDPREMSMGMILRSSKRFKKAKFTAVQSQGADTESQPIELVPDSQANS